MLLPVEQLTMEIEQPMRTTLPVLAHSGIPCRKRVAPVVAGVVESESAPLLLWSRVAGRRYEIAVRST